MVDLALVDIGGLAETIERRIADPGSARRHFTRIKRFRFVSALAGQVINPLFTFRVAVGTVVAPTGRSKIALLLAKFDRLVSDGGACRDHECSDDPTTAGKHHLRRSNHVGNVPCETRQSAHLQQPTPVVA